MLCIQNVHFPQHNYWMNKNVLVVMGHNKCGFPLIRALINMGTNVIAVSRYKRQSELMRIILTEAEQRYLITREADLHSILNVQALLKELTMTVGQIHLLIILIPKITLQQNESLYEKGNEALLQSVMEIDDLCAGSLASMVRKLIGPTSGHIWMIRFNHKQADVVWDYVQDLLNMAEAAPTDVNVFLMRNNNNGEVNV